MIRQKDVEIRQKDVQLEYLTSQLREREGRLRQKERELQQKDTQIQQKDEEIQQKNADISRLQREKQVGIKIIVSYELCKRSKAHKIISFMQCVSLQESLLRVTQHFAAEQRPTVKVATLGHVITLLIIIIVYNTDTE